MIELKEYSLIGKIGSFNLQILSSSLSALVKKKIKLRKFFLVNFKTTWLDKCTIK